jgi:hypothetical protein
LLALAANLTAQVRGLHVKLGDAQHKICTDSANIRTIQQQIQLLRLGKFGVFLESE